MSVRTVTADAREGVQVFAVAAATVHDSLALAGGPAMPRALARRRGAAADLATADHRTAGPL